jgi:hypothetical protein
MYVPLPILALVAGIFFLWLTSRIVHKRESWLIVVSIIGAIIALAAGVHLYLMHLGAGA